MIAPRIPAPKTDVNTSAVAVNDGLLNAGLGDVRAALARAEAPGEIRSSHAGGGGGLAFDESIVCWIVVIIPAGALRAP